MPPTRKRLPFIIPSKEDIFRELDSGLAHRKEKKTLGEVFTPVSLAEELCDSFPPSVFQQKDARWLDPATGMGIFMVVVFYRLMDGLAKHIPSETERANHIVQHMLFMVDINPSSIRSCHSLFQRLCPTAHLHASVADFLEGLPPSYPSSFSCIIGNPPYNLGGTKRVGTKRIHLPFTQRALEILEHDGYLAYICPPSYREAATPMNLMLQQAGGHLVSLRILGAKETYQHFRIQGRVDLLLYQTHGKAGKAGKAGETHLIDELGEHYRIRWDMSHHFPNFGWRIFQRLFQAVQRLGKVEAFRTTEGTTVGMSGQKPSQGKHRLLHLIVEEGRRVIHRSVPHSLENIPKLFVNGLGLPYVYYDKKGEYGPTQTPIVILRPNLAVVRMLQSPLFVFIAWGLRLTGNNNLPYLFDAVPQVRRSYVKEIGLTQQDMDWMAQHFPPYVFQDQDIP